MVVAESMAAVMTMAMMVATSSPRVTGRGEAEHVIEVVNNLFPPTYT